MDIRYCLGSAALLASLGLAAPANAHIMFADPSGKAGSYYAGFLRVSHGCAGSPTISIRVAIPAEILIARPQPKPGWTLAVEKAPLPTPIRSEGGEVRDRVTAITWSGRLDADQFDQFGVMLKLPDSPGAFYFPTVQRCEAGHNDWTTVPVAGQTGRPRENPAPMLTVTPGAPAGMEHMHM